MSFDLKPELNGNLLRLRGLRKEDFHRLYAVARDPLVWEQHPDKNRYNKNIFRRFFLQALASDAALIVIDQKNGDVIGSSRFHAYDDKKSEIEIGWSFLARRYWGGAYNAQLKQLMLCHAFKFVKTVVFVIGIDNLRSQRAVEKIGAVFAGNKHNSKDAANRVYKITKTQFLS